MVCCRAGATRPDRATCTWCRKRPPIRPRTNITYRVRQCRSTVCHIFTIRERRMTEIKHEQRSVVVPVELRAKGDRGQTIAGYAAIFGETADIGGYFRQSIAKDRKSTRLKYCHEST